MGETRGGRHDGVESQMDRTVAIVVFSRLLVLRPQRGAASMNKVRIYSPTMVASAGRPNLSLLAMCRTTTVLRVQVTKEKGKWVANEFAQRADMNGEKLG